MRDLRGFFVLTIPEKVGSFEAVIDLLNPRVPSLSFHDKIPERF